MSHWKGCPRDIIAIDGKGSYCRRCGTAITTTPQVAGSIGAGKSEARAAQTAGPLTGNPKEAHR